MEIKQYWGIVKKRIWLILLIVTIAPITSWYYTNKYITPIYTASSKVIVNKVSSGDYGQEQMDMGALATNIAITTTYREIILSTAVMDKVVQQFPELNVSSKSLLHMAHVDVLTRTPVMVISVNATDYKWAATAANAIVTVFKNEVPSLMKIDNIFILSEASLNDHAAPINDNMKQNVILSFMVALLFSIGIIFLWEYMDTRLKNEEDVSNLFGVPVLTVAAKLNPKDFQPQTRKSGRVGEAQYATANR
ncbi:YveK family protein [Gorillibacterium massiliense]|uniref:YveK family protein n=1 Tax=Gorillibacterium massiliense TaxID=1280390 RepID=UPI0004B0BED9|nr:Wzz/FepE/Etk N-terminal domain-containing protein [Gorillibacterium massiliense]